MARRVKAPTENRTSRLKLLIRRKPYHFTTIAPGIAIGYRRCQSAGRWILRAGNGRGGHWTSAFGLADDYEPANGSTVLDFWQAQDKARALVRGKDAGDRPVAVAEALDAYEKDLAARGGAVANARLVRNLLPSSILRKTVALISARELRHWRDGLLDGRQASSVNRYLKSFKAALNLAAAHDPRISNATAWRAALAGLPDSNTARHVALPESAVRAIVLAAYAVDPAFGLWVEVAAVTGARPSQIARLDVADLQADRLARLQMPSSLKGSGRKRIERRPVPIPSSLAIKLRRSVAGKSPDAPLLPRPDGGRWQRSDHGQPFAQAAAAAGLANTTAYALRHSSVIRSLLAGVPLSVVAMGHDTSPAIIASNYGAYILDHSDAISRAALLDLAAE